MELTQELSKLLSLSSTSKEHLQALENIQTLLIETTTSQSKQSAWRSSQDQLHLNAANAVLEFVSRIAYRSQLIDTLDFPTLSTALKLLQGLILVHVPSCSLFSRPSTLETLLVLIANPAASLQASQSPVPGSQEAELPVLVLDTILCGLADHPENTRAFEQVGGVAEVVRLLRSKQVGKQTRMKCLETLYFYLLPEENDASTSNQEAKPQPSVPSSPSTPKRTRYRSESLRAVLERADVEWSPRTPRKNARFTPEPSPLSPSFSTPNFTPFASGSGNPGLGISQGPSGQQAPPSQPTVLFTPSSSSSRPSLSRPSSQRSDSDNPFSPSVDQTTPKLSQRPSHDKAFFSSMASNTRMKRSQSSVDPFGPVRSASNSPRPTPTSTPSQPSSPKQAVRSPLKRSSLSSPARKNDVTPRSSQSPRPAATPINRHPIVPLPSRRRSSLANQEQIAPISSPSFTRSHTATDLSSTPKNTLSRSQSEQSPLTELLGGSKHLDSPAKEQESGGTPDLRRRASVQLSQSRSVLRQSLGLLSTSNSGTPSRRSRETQSQSSAPASPLRDRRLAPASGPSQPSSPRHAVKRKVSVPSPISNSKSSSSTSPTPSSAEAKMSVEHKKQLLGRHLDDVEGLVSRFQGFAVR